MPTCCSPAHFASQEANQDPIDLAFLAAAKERHVFEGVLAVTPVSFSRRLMRRTGGRKPWSSRTGSGCA